MTRTGGAFLLSLLGHTDTNAMLKNQNTNLVACPSEARGWTQILARYRTPSPTRNIIELIITAGPLVLLWFLMWATLDLGDWVCPLLAVPAAGFLVRLFMIPPILVFITSIICAAGYLTTDCHSSCAITRNSACLAGLR